MSAMIKLDQGLARRYLGLVADGVPFELHADKMGLRVAATTEGDKPYELVVNSRVTLLLPEVDVRRFFCLVVPHPALHEHAVVAGSLLIPPESGRLTPRLHLTGLKKFNVAELPWAALLYLVD